MKNASALLSDGTLKGEFMPQRVGVEVIYVDALKPGMRTPVSELLRFDTHYGPYGQRGCVDVAEDVAEMWGSAIDSDHAHFPIATVYASQAIFRELCDEVGTIDPDDTRGCDTDCDGCLYCVPAV